MAKILVADPEKAVGGVLRHVLQIDDHEVKSAQDGPAALDMLLQEPFDMAILETSLPEVDGLAICRHLRAETATAGMAVVFLTARCSQRDKIEGFAAGCDQYIIKPISVHELRWRIRSLLRRAELGAAQAAEYRPADLGRERKPRQNWATHRHADPVEYELLMYLAQKPG